MPFGPTFPNVGTGSFFTNGVQFVGAHDLARRDIPSGYWGLHPNPVRLSRDFGVWAVNLFWMALGHLWLLVGTAVNDDGHASDIDGTGWKIIMLGVAAGLRIGNIVPILYFAYQGA